MIDHLKNNIQPIGEVSQGTSAEPIGEVSQGTSAGSYFMYTYNCLTFSNYINAVDFHDGLLRATA